MISESTEIFKDIPGYEGIYQVSDNGKVKALSVLKYWGRVKQKRREVIFKPTVRKHGYAEVVLYGEKRRNYGVHRLVAITFIPNPNNKPQVNHIDGNKLNNHVSNLEWATAQEQADHAISLSLVNSVGENNPNSKLTKDQVLEIRSLKGKFTHNELSKMFNVHPGAIQKIQLRIAWKHI